MGQFVFYETNIDGVYIIEPAVLEDERGYFMETYNQSDFTEAGINACFVQDNQSRSIKGVLRGLHFQKKYPQAKLVRVVSGEVFDVAVDIRQNSKTYGRWVGVTLTSANKKQLFVPRGFAHGFLVISDEAEFVYKCDQFYYPHDQGGLMWNDPLISITWPETSKKKLSEKDSHNQDLLSYEQNFKAQDFDSTYVH